MKTLLTMIFLLITFCTSAQLKIIKGIAVDSTNGKNFVSIVKNDTINKFSKINLPEYDAPDSAQVTLWLRKYNELQALRKDTNYSVTTNTLGNFSITANIKDSLTFSSYGHVTEKYAVKDLLKMPDINIRLKPLPCEPLVRCNDTIPQNTYAFVAEKIEVKRVNRNYCGILIMFDGEYSARYRIIKNIYGNFKSDTINFTAYDHYGKPAFSRHQYVLLFVSQYCNKLIHNKYQYFEVYPTADGRWATPGDPYRYDSYIKEKNIKAQPIIFADNLAFSTKKTSKNYLITYEAPYFQIMNGQAKPLLGTYAEDLFNIKKGGALKRLDLK